MMVVVFALVYGAMWEHFNFEAPIDPLYFSAMVTSTVGFGDFLPGTTPGKVAVIAHQLLVIVGVISVVEALFAKRV